MGGNHCFHGHFTDEKTEVKRTLRFNEKADISACISWA